MNKLFIGGFPIEMTELELVQLIAPYADVVTIKLVRDRATKKCKGYGFIEVADKQHAINAIDGLNNTIIGDRVLSLNMVPEQPAAKPRPFYSKEKRVQPSDRIKRPRRPRF
jgi:RNA recognition motif-containing protein